MIRRIVGQILQGCGYSYVLAENGRKGYETAKKEMPDLVIMDIEMPEMDGFEATALIKSDPQTAHIPVLFFTSLGREEDLQNAAQAGGNGFLNKPISKEDLKDALNKIFS
jgi:CheY-like chemotaxis protein